MEEVKANRAHDRMYVGPHSPKCSLDPQARETRSTGGRDRFVYINRFEF